METLKHYSHCSSFYHLGCSNFRKFFSLSANKFSFCNKVSKNRTSFSTLKCKLNLNHESNRSSNNSYICSFVDSHPLFIKNGMEKNSLCGFNSFKGFERAFFSVPAKPFQTNVWNSIHLQNSIPLSSNARPISSSINQDDSSTLLHSNEQTTNDILLSKLCDGLAPNWLLQRLEKIGYSKATQTQIESLPIAFSNSDVFLHAQTGSGKTLSFLIPLISAIDSKQRNVQALIIVPSRELGIQVARVARQLVGQSESISEDEEEEEENEKKEKKDKKERKEKKEIKKENGEEMLVMGHENDVVQKNNFEKIENGRKNKISVMALLDGGNSKRQKIWLKADPPHIIVGNSDQILKLVVSNNLRLSKLKFVVVDEVDEVIKNSKFSSLGSFQKLFSFFSLPEKRKNIFCSATFAQHNRFVQECIHKKWTKKDLIHVHVKRNEKISPFIQHKYIVCEKEEKLKMIFDLILKDNPRSGIIFTNQQSLKDKNDGNPLTAEIIQNYFLEKLPLLSNQPAESSQMESGQRFFEPLLLVENDHVNKRTSSLQAFRDSEAGILISTDLASRGLDIPNVSHIYNFDLPVDADAYVHRAGRTARKPIDQEIGYVTTLVSSKETFVLNRIENALGINIVHDL